ncbi:hypothetical protein [Shivajiella indica]|uniref:Uncharacterized protein n=1 Tax=Shivajiella indica TaxID=872115 RepID=A0ABW5B9C2_9BACT
MAWNQLVSQPIWERLVNLPSLNQAQNQIMALDSILGRSGKLEKALKGNQFVVSVHPIGREEFDFLFTISLESLSDIGFLSDLEKNLPPLSQINKRSYSNVTIKEFQSLDLERNLNYTIVNNVFVASYTSFLVEEAIRHSQNDNLPNFRSVYNHLVDELPSSKGLGIFRFSSEGFGKLITGISRQADLTLVNSFARTGISANLELKFADEKILLDGMVYFKDGKEIDFKVNPQGDIKTFENFISNRTSVLYQYNLAHLDQLTKVEDPGFQSNSTLSGDIEKVLIQKGFLNNLKGNIAYLLFEVINNEPQDQVLLLQTDQIAEQINILKEFDMGPDETVSQVLPVDFYSQNEIFMISSEEFPGHIFGGRFLGFPDTYITSIGGFLVFANSSKAMKLFIDDINNDNTWGKSLQQKKLLEGISPDAGYNFLINIPRFWNSINQISSPNWQGFFQKYAPQLKSIDQISLQVKESENKHLVSVELAYNLSPIINVQDVLLNENKYVQFENRLIYGPVSVQNFVDRSFEFVVQDENNFVHLFTSEGELVFAYQVDSPLVSNIFQVDYYKNGKLQLLFATENQIYIIDRLGNLIPGYPVSFPGEIITHLNLVDYSNSKDYRFFVGTENGNLILLDKNGKALEGWDPKKINGPLAIKPAHHRIAGVGDRMVALSAKGELYFFNRRGEPELGSPIRLGEGLNSDYILLERGSAKASRLVTVTKEGEVVQVNLQGELTYRNQLLRPDRESKFYLIKDQKEDRYLFVVHEYNKITVMDTEYKTLFAIDIFSESLDFQFFSYGSDKNIFVIVDKDQEFIYLYNLEGNLLNTRPVNGSQKIDIKYSGSQNEYTVNVISGNRFSEYKLPL